MATAAFFTTISFSPGGVYVNACNFSGVCLAVRNAAWLEGAIVKLVDAEDKEIIKSLVPGLTMGGNRSARQGCVVGLVRKRRG